MDHAADGWAKKQGAYTGYAHSANGLNINAVAAAKRLLAELDTNKDQSLSRAEAAKGLLPEGFDAMDANKDGMLTEKELTASLLRVSSRLPNLAIPELAGIGAQEIFVTSARGCATSSAPWTRSAFRSGIAGITS